MDKTKAILSEIFGVGGVEDNPDALEAYSYDESSIKGIKPWFIVKPENADQIQKLVIYANEALIPLVTVSSGAPHFRGDTLPGAPGSIVLDLSRMNKIIRIDRRNRMALIEPGVTYTQLQPELAKHDLRLSTPLAPRASKSVIASLLEREPTLTPKYNYVLPEPLRCLEIIFGDGKVQRTGDSSGYPSLEKQWEMGFAQVAPTGPGQVDYHRLVSGAQGSMGIITWASVKCEIMPKVHRFFMIPADRLEDLISCAYQILRVRLGDEFFILNQAGLSSFLGKDRAEIEMYKDKLPPWTIIIGIAGRDILPEDKVNFQERDIRNLAQKSGLLVLPVVPGIKDNQIKEAIYQPSRGNCWKTTFKGGCRELFFLTTLDKTPLFINSLNQLAESSGINVKDIGVYLQPQHQGTTCHCEFDLPYNPSDNTDVSRADRLLIKGSEILINQGAFFSRPYGIWAEMVYNRDAANTWLLKNVKDIFDPRHILNPGKLCF